MAVALALVVLVALVALASGARQPFATSSNRGHLGVELVVGLAVAALLLALVYALVRYPKAAFVLVALFILLAIAVPLLVSHFPDPTEPERRPPAGGRNVEQERPRPAEPARTHRATRSISPWLWLALGGALATLVLAALLFLQQREPLTEVAWLDQAEPEDADGDERSEIVRALTETIDDLYAEPDPRRAVVAAYARMEGVLARAGLPRQGSDTPSEYLERVLLAHAVEPASIERLTTLFAQAKFSLHNVDERMRNEAVDALVTVRDELARRGGTDA